MHLHNVVCPQCHGLMQKMHSDICSAGLYVLLNSDFPELKRETDLDVKIEKLGKKLKRSHRSNYANCNFYGYD